MASKSKTIVIKNNIEKVIKNVIRHNFRRIENEKIISTDKTNLPFLDVLSYLKFCCLQICTTLYNTELKSSSFFFSFSIFFSEMSYG